MSLEQEFELIRRVPIFSTTDPAMQKLLAFSSDRLTYEEGQTMFSAGDPPDSAYIVMEGEVDITVPTPKGALLVNTLTRNDVIGEIGIFGEDFYQRDGGIEGFPWHSSIQRPPDSSVGSGLARPRQRDGQADKDPLPLRQLRRGTG